MSFFVGSCSRVPHFVLLLPFTLHDRHCHFTVLLTSTLRTTILIIIISLLLPSSSSHATIAQSSSIATARQSLRVPERHYHNKHHHATTSSPNYSITKLLHHQTIPSPNYSITYCIIVYSSTRLFYQNGSREPSSGHHQLPTPESSRPSDHRV